MYISYIIYIIWNSRCYTGVRAPKLSHRSSYIKEPFGKGLDGLPGAGRGLQKGLKEACGAWDPFKVASRGLEKGFKGASRGLACLNGASRGLEKGFKGASRGLEKGLKGASRWRGLQGGLKGAWEGLQGGFKGAWEGLQGGFKGASSPSHLRPPPGRDPSSPPWRVPSKVVARIQPPPRTLKTSSKNTGAPRKENIMHPARRPTSSTDVLPTQYDDCKSTTERILRVPWVP